MGWEIERKFLITDMSWKRAAQGVSLRQGYLSADRDRVVRVRIEDALAVLTIKGPARGATRREFEYDIPTSDAEELLQLCSASLIEKTRYRIVHDENIWEVDEFHGDNAGLFVAECELESENQPLLLPSWVGREVTGDPRYANSNLVAKPYSSW